MTLLRRLTVAAVSLAVNVLAAPAAAQSATTSSQVTANVLPICTISATAIDVRVPAGQDAPAGAHLDGDTATVSF